MANSWMDISLVGILVCVLSYYGLLITLRSILKYAYTVDVSTLPNILLDVCIRFVTGGVPARHQFLRGQEKIHEAKGNTFRVNYLNVKSIYSNEKENIQSVWARNFDDWESGSIRFSVVGAFVGHGIVTTDGHRWTEVRTIAKHALAGDPMKDFHAFKAVADKWIGGVSAKDKVTDVHPLLFDLYFDACWAFLVGRSLNDQDMAAFGCSITSGRGHLDNGMKISKTRYNLGPFKSFVQKKEWIASCEFRDRYASYAAEEGMRWVSDDNMDHSKPTCLIQRLALEFPDLETLKNEILQYSIGTHSTVPGLLTQTILQLAQRPDIWRELHKEVSEADYVPDAIPDKLNLPLLSNVLMEGLRLYPSTPFAFREAKRDTTLPRGGGPDHKDHMFVPKGTRFCANIFALHRDSEVYGSNPLVFDPDRWSIIKPTHWEFMPFSRGRRICLGKDKGLREAKYILYLLARRFKDIEATEATIFTNKTQGIPLSCRVKLRQA